MEHTGSLQLPLELVELVLDLVSLGPRQDSMRSLLACSLTNSALLPLCRKHIFHTVYLWPYIPEGDRTKPSQETLEYDRRASLLVRAVNTNPALGRYVRRLSHQVTSSPPDGFNGLDDLARAMGTMSSISELELGIRAASLDSRITNTSLDFRKVPPGRWKETISTLVGHPQLKTLRLSCINALPLDTFPVGVQALHLKSTWLPFVRGLGPNVDHPCLPLRSLSCDTLSLMRVINHYRRANPQPWPPERMVVGSLDLSTIERLCLKLLSRNAEHYAPVVRQATRLSHLELFVPHSITPRSEQHVFLSLPLSQLHHASLHSLSHLAVHNTFNFRGPRLQLLNPYTRILEDFDAFAQLTSLERLSINIDLEGCLDLDPRTMDPIRWIRLSNILTMDGACPKLRAVAIFVRVQVSNTPLVASAIGKTVAECKEDAERLVERLSDLTRNPQWWSVAARPEVKFSFETEVCMGPRFWPMEDMASPRLPLELIELVLDSIPLGSQQDGLPSLLACSLTNSALRPLCQKHIFHTVHLWPYIPGVSRGNASRETLEWDRRAILLVQTLKAKPALGRYVQRLSHQVTLPPPDGYPGLDDMLRAMEMMPNIADLELGLRAADASSGLSSGNFRLMLPGRWKLAISTLVGRPQLKILRLSYISSLPLDLISAGIQELHLNQSWFSSDSRRSTE
ncbi:hypothetical protein NMY22_g2406 [Coprinellus aureogranulatus]|nr:hypothetical protein NMY22_g2406 [Coprinellus aureogranulatus]